MSTRPDPGAIPNPIAIHPDIIRPGRLGRRFGERLRGRRLRGSGADLRFGNGKAGDDGAGCADEEINHMIADAGMCQVDNIIGGQMIDGMRISDDGDNVIGGESEFGHDFDVRQGQWLRRLDPAACVGRFLAKSGHLVGIQWRRSDSLRLRRRQSDGRRRHGR